MKFEIGNAVTVQGHFPPQDPGIVTKVTENHRGGVTIYEVTMDTGVLYKGMTDRELTKIP